MESLVVRPFRLIPHPLDLVKDFRSLLVSAFIVAKWNERLLSFVRAILLSALAFGMAIGTSVAQESTSSQNGSGIESLKNQFSESFSAMSRNAFQKSERIPPARKEELFLEYFSRYLSKDIESLHAEELKVLHPALASAMSADADQTLVEYFTDVTSELERRNLKRESGGAGTYAQEAYNVLIGARRFDLANEVASAHAGKVRTLGYSFPSLDVGDLPALLRRLPGSSGREWSQIDIGNGLWFVGVVHTACPYSEKAIQYIEQRADKYSDLLPENTIWVAGQDVTHILPFLERWNDESELVDIHVTYEDERWPRGVILSATPVFYLLDDGEVIDRLSGWANDNQSKNLDSMLGRAKGR